MKLLITTTLLTTSLFAGHGGQFETGTLVSMNRANTGEVCAKSVTAFAYWASSSRTCVPTHELQYFVTVGQHTYTLEQRSLMENMRKMNGHGGVIPSSGVLSGTQMGAQVGVLFDTKEVRVRVGKRESKYTVIGVDDSSNLSQAQPAGLGPTATPGATAPLVVINMAAPPTTATPADVIFQAADGKFYHKAPGHSYIEEVKLGPPTPYVAPVIISAPTTRSYTIGPNVGVTNTPTTP